MERNPIRFAWRHARALHLGVFFVLVIMAPLNWLLLELPRLLVDDAVLGHAFRNAPTAPFLQFRLQSAFPFLAEELVLFQGLALERRDYFLACCIAVIVLLLLRSMILAYIAATRGAVARRAAMALRENLLRRLLGAGGASQDDVEASTRLASGGVAAIAWFLGDALIVPAMAFTQLAIVLLFGASLGLASGAMLVALAAINSLAAIWMTRAEREVNVVGGDRERTLRRATRSAAARAMAIRIHGAVDVEAGVYRNMLTALDARWRSSTSALSLAAAARGFVRECGPLLMIVWGCWGVMNNHLSVGGMTALVMASILLQRPVNALVIWRRERQEAREVLDDIARAGGQMAARRLAPTSPAEAVTDVDGPLAFRNVAALDPASGVRISGVNLNIDLPAHVAVIGDAKSGANAFASLLGGAMEPSGGDVLLGGRSLPGIDAPRRMRRIAWAGGAPIVLEGSVRENLLYGAVDWRGDRVKTIAGAGVDDDALITAVSIAGVDDEVYALGLAGPLPAGADAATVEQVIGARRAVREALEREDAATLVDPFNPLEYNNHATVAENLLFGRAVGDTFGETNLAGHPFVRAVIAAENLGPQLERVGLAMAQSMLEMFDGVPEGHPLFQRFSFFQSGERGAFEELVDRHSSQQRPRGASGARDHRLLVNLAFRYVESRHRLGLLDDDLKQKLVSARAAFRTLLPRSLEAAVEFYDPGKLCMAASLADNLLFGRVTHDIAQAEDRVQAVVRRVLEEKGLDGLVMRNGLAARIGPQDPGALSGREPQLDLARCLMRQPEILVASGLTENLTPPEAAGLLARLRAHLQGRSLFMTMAGPELAQDQNMETLTFVRGALTGYTTPGEKTNDCPPIGAALATNDDHAAGGA